MNLNRINDYPGTGTNAQPSWSDKPFKDYGKDIAKILVTFILFAWSTSTNYCNTLQMVNVDTDYPIDKTTLDTLSAKNENPYCSNLVSNEYISDVNKDRNKFQSMSRWFQTTQESSYEIGGKILNKFFKFSKSLLGKTHTLNIQTSLKPVASKNIEFKASDDGFLSFFIWLVFGAFTQFSFSCMLVLLFAMWIPGWIGGLLAFMPMTYATQSLALKGLYKITVFICSFILMCVVGFVSGFPVIYEFGYLFYLFYFKQLFSDDPMIVTNEFMRRMKPFILVFVIVALIMAAVQLPPASAVIMAVVVLVSGGISYYLSSHNQNQKAPA